jgi:hypothetical protein
LRKGTAQGAANLITLHPVRAGAFVGTGAAIAGKDVAVGTVKGSGKIAKGIGRAFKKVFGFALTLFDGGRTGSENSLMK